MDERGAVLLVVNLTGGRPVGILTTLPRLEFDRLESIIHLFDERYSDE